MKLTGIEIQDTYGTSTLHVGPFSVLRLRGANASGKTSVIRALSYIFAGGCDSSVIKQGAERSLVKLTFDDGSTVTKTTRPKRDRKGGAITGYVADLECAQPDGSPRPAPQSYIQELGSVMAVDPATLLKIDATKAPGRAALCAELLRLVPISFDPDDVNRACAYKSTWEAAEPDTIALPESPATPLDLAGLKKAVESVSEQRRRAGIHRDDAQGAESRLRSTLQAPAVGIDYDADLEAAEEQRRDVESIIAAKKLEYSNERSNALGGAQQKLHEAQAEATRIYDAAMKAAGDAFVADKQSANDAYQRALDALETESRPVLNEAIADVRAKQDALAESNRAAGILQEIDRNLKLFKEKSYIYDRLSEVLLRLEGLRLEKLKRLPVAGLLVENGEAYLDGIPWQNANLARRVQAVLEICAANAGRLPLLLIDDAEHLDSEMRQAIEQGLVDAGYQIITACVSEGPLTIEVLAEAA